MSTASLVIDANQSGLAYTADLNSGLAAINTCHSGANAPTTQVETGKLWLDTGGTNPVLKIYRNGWKSLFTITATNVSTSVNALTTATANVTTLTTATANVTTLTTATANVTSTSTFTGLITANGGVKTSNISTTSGDITLKSAGDNVYMQGTTENEQINFTLGESSQAIIASDDLNVGATDGDLTLYTTTSGDVDFNPASGKIGLWDNGTEQAGFDVNSASTLKIYTGSNFGTLNSTFTNSELRVEGDVTAFYSSDINLKENIVKIDNALDKITAIRGVYFDWSDEHIKNRGGEDGYFVQKHDVGIIAQEVEKVLPEVVKDRSDGTKAVDYHKMIALLIEGVKEQQVKIEALEKRLGDE
jgi:hypothetical protein